MSYIIKVGDKIPLVDDKAIKAPNIGIVDEALTITENGTIVTPNAKRYNPITVSVPSIEPVIEPLSVTANGTYIPTSGVDGYSPVSVNVPAPAINLQNKTVTENGTVTADSSYDGLGAVDVNVPQGVFPTGNINITDTNVTDVTNYATAQIVDANLVAANIKKDVNILGVIGSFEGGGFLPSIISKLDGGSFTLAVDTFTKDYKIEHNLGTAPKMFHIWTDELAEFTNVDKYYLKDASFVNQDVQQTSSSSARGISHYSRRNIGGNMAGGIGYVPETSYPSWVDGTNKIGCDVGSTYYKAGCTYKWIAWA